MAERKAGRPPKETAVSVGIQTEPEIVIVVGEETSTSQRLRPLL